MSFFRHHLFCCTNRREPGHSRGCCADKSADALRDYLKWKTKEEGIPSVRVNNAGCLDRCEQGPCIVIYPDAVWYAPHNKQDIDEIVEEHLKNGRVVERLRIPGN